VTAPAGRRPRRDARRAAAALGAALLGLLLSSCVHAADPSADEGPAAAVSPNGGTPAATLRLGYFANLTHSTPIVGVAEGYYASRLGATRLGTQIFKAGPDEMTALLSGQLDAAYVGPSSALTSFAASHGRGLVIVAGAEVGGAELVVAPGITSAAQLRGKTLADPQLGNTQDVALRYWLAQQGFRTSLQGSGDVDVQPTDNATTLTLFRTGRIAGAWAPEPWASRLVVDGGGHVLVDERSLWLHGDFATTVLVVRADYLAAHPQTVKELISGQIAANDWITAHPAAAQTLVNRQIAQLTGTTLEPAVLARAWSEESVADDPVAASLRLELGHAVSVGLLRASTPLNGIFDLTLLDEDLRALGRPGVDADGLGAA
jgi:NitT/TauT family transport system substrate-binding protein